VVDAAIDWIKQQPPNQPWMVSLSFATTHTPLMQPPSQALPSTEPDSSNVDCSGTVGQRIVSNEMEEALDFEIGRFMTATGSRPPGRMGS
jgi:hypothetical protein